LAFVATRLVSLELAISQLALRTSEGGTRKRKNKRKGKIFKKLIFQIKYLKIPYGRFLKVFSPS